MPLALILGFRQRSPLYLVPCLRVGHSGASAGASSRPDTEPRTDASPSSGALSLSGKQLPPVPSSTLRTSLDTEVPMEQRLQDPVTYSFAQDGNILLTNVISWDPSSSLPSS